MNGPGESILITGGTGTLGRALVDRCLRTEPGVRRLVVFSRDEVKQSEMQQAYPADRYPGLRFFLGDVRDAARLARACEGIDTIIHAAALKQVPAAEYNPFEFIRTNILGAQHVIDAALACGAARVVALSTDKAAAPINLYGATKLCSDKLFTSANNIRGSRLIRFSVVRYGNVLGSRGSVVPFFLRHRERGVLPITHPEMTRFSLTVEEAVDLVLRTIRTARGGEIIVPKIPSYRLLDLAEAIAPGARHEIVGVRPGEKIHEEMITPSDALSTWDLGDHYAILPATPGFDVREFALETGARPVPEGFRYQSRDNDHWLGVPELRDLIRRHLDPEFQPCVVAA